MKEILTLCAKSKLNYLLSSSDREAVSIVSNPDGGFGFHFDDRYNCDIVISVSPKILTDAFTIKRLSASAIDFCYTENDFIIKRDAVCR